MSIGGQHNLGFRFTILDEHHGAGLGHRYAKKRRSQDRRHDTFREFTH
ncbi:MAG TPA: hypothetical protein PKW60_07470 [Candidatus Hydrogenedentes bacterium]|nr:hypothetical protein [Candidatus Hydrogenedentota bacterium]